MGRSNGGAGGSSPPTTNHLMEPVSHHDALPAGPGPPGSCVTSDQALLVRRCSAIGGSCRRGSSDHGSGTSLLSLGGGTAMVITTLLHWGDRGVLAAPCNGFKTEDLNS